MLTRIDAVTAIAVAYLGRNQCDVTYIPSVLTLIDDALAKLEQPAQAPAAELIPAVPVKKSVTPDAIISLEDGKPYLMLKRHLTALGMTPDQYRAKWNLPAEYPMVAPNYSARRSQFAKQIGLGKRRSLKVVGGVKAA